MIIYLVDSFYNGLMNLQPVTSLRQLVIDELLH